MAIFRQMYRQNTEERKSHTRKWKQEIETEITTLKQLRYQYCVQKKCPLSSAPEELASKMGRVYTSE